jgi:uroporphyrinogen-III synthase
MRVLITRSREQAGDFAEALRAIGADPVFFPTIAIQPVDDTTTLDQALSQLDRYNWLVFTSANAVDSVIERLQNLGIDRLPKGLMVATIGPKTATRLESCGITPNFIPKQYIAEAILPGLGDLTNCRVFLPMADIAHDTLPNAIKSAGGIPHVITAYHTVLADPDGDGITALQAGVDVITFTSGSTVCNFFTLAQNAGLDPLNLPSNPIIACIGPKTTHTAQRLGLVVEMVANPHNTDGLIQAIQNKMSV